MRNKLSRARTKRSAARNAHGTMIIAAALLSLAFVALVTPAVLFVANVSTQLALQEQASHIAEQTASIVDDYRYWLGAPRPGFDRNKAVEVANLAATRMCEQTGLKSPRVSLTFERDQQGNDLTVCSLAADAADKLPSRASIFGLDLGHYFTGKLNVRAARTHSQVSAYSIMHFDAPTAEDQVYTRPLGLNRRDVAVIPTYGFVNHMVGGAKDTKAIPYGPGIADLAPEVFFSMNYYSMKKADIDYVNQTGQAYPLESWNVTRIIGDKSLDFK